MAFRADESAKAGLDSVLKYFLPHCKGVSYLDRKRENEELFEILQECGPVVDAYPSWHPLVRNHNDRYPVTHPSRDCGYEGLDHTRYFVSGFITCPYGDGQSVLDSVARLPRSSGAVISARRLNMNLYHPDTTPILVQCDWEKPLEANGAIPLSLAMPLLLEKEVPCWEWAAVAETWETMRPYFLGTPHGSRSSLFVSQETGNAMRKVWDALICTGMFGPIR
jgi:hypothetical protein